MASVNPPYFFEEFHRPIRRKTPTERERSLGLTLKDLDWLNTLYYATDLARQDEDLREHPMLVEKFILRFSPKISIPLAGPFLMSPSPDAAKALLYTPYGGIEVFDSRDAVIDELTNRLINIKQRIDLIHFLSTNQRQNFTLETPFSLRTAIIPGAVFEDQQQAIEAGQALNMQSMLEELRKTPTLTWMLDTLLSIMARSYFPGLDQRDTRVNSFIDTEGPNEMARWIGSAPLREALLQFYVKQNWPTGHTQTFTNPRHVTRGFTDEQSTTDLQHWHSLVEQTAGILSRLLSSLMQTWWNEDIGDGQSRRELFAQAMSDKFRADLLFKHQAGILSAEESHRLLATFLPDQAARSAWHQPLRIDKVSIHAPYQHYVELATTLIISDEHAYLYTQSRGLQVLKDLDDLNETLLSMLKAAGHEDELLNFLSLEERSRYIAMETVQVRGLPVLGSVFGELVDDIAAKQLSNMEYALGQFRRSDGAIDLAALLDCSLDLRHMLDNRLLTLDAKGRWSLHPISSGNGRPSTMQAERAKQQLQAVLAAQAGLAVQRSNHPTLRRLALHALNAELQKRLLDIDANDVFANTYATQAAQREEREPLQSVSMLDHFIARLAKAGGPLGSTPRQGFYSRRREGAAMRWNTLNSSTFNAIIDATIVPFANHDIRVFPRQFLESYRTPLGSALLQGLRSEAALRLLNKTLPPRHHAILDTVLRPDSMTRVQRHGLLGFLPDAYRLTLTIGSAPQLWGLANCFVLTERGGVDPTRSGQVALWTPQHGHEPFASLQALQDALALRLTQPDKRLALMQNLPISRCKPHQTYQLGPLQRIDEHLLNDRQDSYLDYLIDDIDHWLAAPLSPGQLQDCLDHEMLRAAPSNLDRASAIAQAMIHQQALPVWLGMAPPLEQKLHAELVEQYRLSTLDERDYLHGLPPLREHVASSLRQLLDARFPGLALDPDDVLIPARPVFNGHVQSLTDFALRHLPDLHADGIRPYARGATPLPPTLDGSAVVQLVRQLDIASTYRTLLTTHLTSDTDDTRERRALFCRQLPWQLLRHAHEEKLEERLSATAWGLIQQVIDMPDAVARENVSGATAMIRPLALIATPGAQTVEVLGLYLIGPPTGASGPVVLYAPYGPFRVLVEYAREEELLDEINRSGPLQNWVIRQIDAPHQATYKNLLRAPRSEGPSDIRLASNPVRGNTLLRLFRDNARQLIKMLTCQFEEGGLDEWDGVTSLLQKDLQMALQFIAGKLKYPLVVWRSFKLFQASAEAQQQQRFGEGLQKFIQGVAKLASLRQALDGLLEPSPAPATTPMTNSSTPATTTLDTVDVTDPTRTWMQRFEDTTVALADLTAPTQAQPYSDLPRNRHYVPVSGKVYPVQKAGESWRVSLGQELGPYVERNAQGQWVLDLSEREPRFGPTLSRYRGRVITRRTERSSINIQAQGMPAIRALNQDNALCIDRALNVALYYAFICSRNLTLFAQQRSSDSATSRLLTEMFGTLNFTPAQVSKIQGRVQEILDGLTHQSLLTLDSDRFVVGTARWFPEQTFAFVIPEDREQKIYLLDLFFNTHMSTYQGHLNVPFDIDDHARAATLIHEMSHLVSNTEDIAYMDAMRPFRDLINRGTAEGLRKYTALDNLQSTALSVLTPATMLFKTWDDLSQRWEDFGSSGSTKVRDKILHLTGTKTLNDARQIFMSDTERRLDIILANADSVTYLITHLGRQLDPGA